MKNPQPHQIHFVRDNSRGEVDIYASKFIPCTNYKGSRFKYWLCNLSLEQRQPAKIVSWSHECSHGQDSQLSFALGEGFTVLSQYDVIKGLKVSPVSGIRSLDISVLEWFDKTYGNSYFAGTIIVNAGQANAKDFTMPFQYGYGNHYLSVASEVLRKAGIISADEKTALWSYCRENGIELRTNKQENCLKRDLMRF